MIVDEISRESSELNRNADSSGDNGCCRSARVVNLHGGWIDTARYFDSKAATAELDRSFSTSSSSTFPREKKYWICGKCRQPTDDPKRCYARVNHLSFYCCSACWKQLRLQMWLGMTFRMIQLHLCFTTLWISSPQGTFLAQKDTNYGEWVAIVVLLVFTLLFQIASFINVVGVRQAALLKQQQRKRPILDIWLEAMCALAWIAIIAFMVHDGIRQYGSNFNGRLIALIVCAVVMLLSYLLTTIVAWSNSIRETATATVGYPHLFAERTRKVNVWQALAYLS